MKCVKHTHFGGRLKFEEIMLGSGLRSPRNGMFMSSKFGLEMGSKCDDVAYVC